MSVCVSVYEHMLDCSVLSIVYANNCVWVGVQEANLQRVQLEVKAGSDLEEVELRVVELLDQVIADCR